MQKNSFLVILLILLIIVGEFFALKYHFDKPDNTSILIEKINNLEKQITELSTKRDSIRLVIDTIETKIITNNVYYEKQVNDIINQSHDSDLLFFSDYISRYAKDHQYNLCGEGQTGN